MTDNKIGPNLRPIGEARPSDKSARKQPAGDQGFSKRLELAMHELETANSQRSVQTAGDTSSLKAAAAAERERFESVMRAQQQLSQAYRDITHKPVPDKE